MSYSRWGYSYWYTFWSSTQEKVETRDNAVFEICSVTRFTAKELRDDIKKCIKSVKELQPNTSKEEINELVSYMRIFLEDVDNEYKNT